jgi:hypothetical protein
MAVQALDMEQVQLVIALVLRMAPGLLDMARQVTALLATERPQDTGQEPMVATSVLRYLVAHIWLLLTSYV